ncbi:GDP-fucose protein O-fucosyltransferase 2 [Periplaneta americana]|uniref:GDP-fucose protein O-fucosyltransferase 2 n=1 Tax=Periplaneta americana TaxID=6978 RepID=UPI0037E9C723
MGSDVISLKLQQKFIIGTVIAIFVACVPQICTSESLGFCSKDDTDCKDGDIIKSVPRFILYDVNPPEGFNLRRDVYMRMARFVRKLKKVGDWHLVLPPWGRMYHWQSLDVGAQDRLPWSLFFDIPSLKRFAPVIEMHEFMREYGNLTLDVVYVLQHYEDMWKSGKWEDKFSIEPCNEEIYYSKLSSGKFRGWFWGYSNITASEVQCLSFHGHVSLLRGVVQNLSARAVMFDHAEVALHDVFGDAVYWQARRSMRFAPVLVRLAANFRAEHLNSTDEADGTTRPDDWTLEKPRSGTKGGPYLCVHMRRKDFLLGRPKHVPSIAGAATQLRQRLKELGLTTVFVATDAPDEEFEELQRHLSSFQVLRYTPAQVVKETYKDGGVAIIEQIICSHARFFIGTYESTFSFRIQEEREIMGFPEARTFNRLCGDAEKKCSPPTAWRIVF